MHLHLAAGGEVEAVARAGVTSRTAVIALEVGTLASGTSSGCLT